MFSVELLLRFCFRLSSIRSSSLVDNNDDDPVKMEAVSFHTAFFLFVLLFPPANNKVSIYHSFIQIFDIGHSSFGTGNGFSSTKSPASSLNFVILFLLSQSARRFCTPTMCLTKNRTLCLRLCKAIDLSNTRQLRQLALAEFTMCTTDKLSQKIITLLFFNL